MQKYVIVDFIDRDNITEEFLFRDWPLHITLLANFTITSPIKALITKLINYGEQLKPFTVTVEGEEMFGPNKDVAVSLIRPSDNLRAIHQALIGITKSLGARYDEPRFLEDGFRPHATIQIKSRLHEGQIVNIDSFTLIDMFPDNDINKRRIIADFNLGHK